MLTAHHISISFNIQTVLEDISFTINAGERVGLVGPNGCGKTTLLRIMAGQVKPDRGHIALNPGHLRVGYLAQGFEPSPELTFGEIIGQAAGDSAQLEAEIGRLGQALAVRPSDERLQERYDSVLRRLRSHEPGRTASLLTALGIGDIPANHPIGLLSGGQKTRLALTLVLLEEPELLLLDEPTNHLDIAVLEWLEDWLVGFPGGVLIVSHDRAFLDQTVTRIIDLDPEKHTIREYSGNYSDFLEQFLNEQEKQRSAYRDQVYEIRRMKQDIARTKEQARRVEITTTPGQPNIRRYAKKVAAKAKAREKKLERFVGSPDRLEKPKQGWRMKLELDRAPHLGRDVLSLEELAVGFRKDRPLLSHLNQHVQAGAHIVLTGPNGCGKTTLLRTVAGRLPALAGRARLGASVRLGYMSQEQVLLNPEDSALATIQPVARLSETEIRSFLHFFLFTGDDSLRPVSDLSFGERARLSLARLVAQGSNFLLLDEPINHLDIPSRERFEQALGTFEGTVLAVVHDRYFIDRFATEVWWVEDGSIESEIRRV